MRSYNRCAEHGTIDNTPTGKLIRNIMLSFSEFEHDLIVQRTQKGKAIARQNAGFKDGRPKKYSRVQLDHALELLETHSYKAGREDEQEASPSTRSQ